jgi:Phosphoenolpyruvate carboxykinase (ATP)
MESLGGTASRASGENAERIHHEFGNVNVKARVDSRSTRSTFIVEDSTNATKQTITRAEFDRIAAEQDAYIAGAHMVVVDGYIGSDPAFRTRARLVMEAANANVAGMQQAALLPRGRRLRPGHLGAGHDGHLHAEPARPGLPERPGHRGGPEQQHHQGAQLRLLR